MGNKTLLYRIPHLHTDVQSCSATCLSTGSGASGGTDVLQPGCCADGNTPKWPIDDTYICYTGVGATTSSGIGCWSGLEPNANTNACVGGGENTGTHLGGSGNCEDGGAAVSTTGACQTGGGA